MVTYLLDSIMKNNQRFLSEGLILTSTASSALRHVASPRWPVFSPANQQAFAPAQFINTRITTRSGDRSRILVVEELRFAAAWEELAYLVVELCGIGAIALAFAG
jgi:hypothetical protein